MHRKKKISKLSNLIVFCFGLMNQELFEEQSNKYQRQLKNTTNLDSFLSLFIF